MFVMTIPAQPLGLRACHDRWKHDSPTLRTLSSVGEIHQRLAKIETEFGETQASPYSSPPQSPEAPSEATLKPHFSPSTQVVVSTLHSPMLSPPNKRKCVNLSNTRFAALKHQADNPEISTIPASSLSASGSLGASLSDDRVHWEGAAISDRRLSGSSLLPLGTLSSVIS